MALTVQEWGTSNRRMVEISSMHGLLRIPRHQLAELIQKLLALPPIEELEGTKPLVLYFKNDADREEMIAALASEMPRMRAVKV